MAKPGWKKIFWAMPFIFHALAAYSAGYPGEVFSTFSFSTRAQGMGQAYTAASDDSAGIFSNPASLKLNRNIGIESFWSSLLMGESGGVFYANPEICWAADFEYLRSDQGESRNGLGEAEGSFQERLSQAGITYSDRLKFRKDLYFGLRAKFLKQELFTEKDSGWGLDGGLLWDVIGRETASPDEIFCPLSLGIRIQNIVSPRLRLGSEEETYPLNLRFGETLRLKNGRYVFAFDQSLDQLKYFAWYLGLEINPVPGLSFRLGKNIKESSIGIGINILSFSLDMAHTFHEAGSRQLVTLKINLGWTGSLRDQELKKKEEELKALEEDLFKINLRTRKNPGITPEAREAARFRLNHTRELYDGKEYYKSLKELAALNEVLSGEREYEEILHMTKAQLLISQNKYREAKAVLYEGLVIEPDSEKLIHMLKRLDRLMEYIRE